MDTVLWFCPSLPTETLKWLSSLPILRQESFCWWQRSDRYIISLFHHLHTPFSPSLINLMVSVDVKHHVYLLKICWAYFPFCTLYSCRHKYIATDQYPDIYAMASLLMTAKVLQHFAEAAGNPLPPSLPLPQQLLYCDHYHVQAVLTYHPKDQNMRLPASPPPPPPPHGD